jgi:hypothetical protein
MPDKKQLNVRLSDEDLANVELLKEHDVPLAEVIREALRQRAQALRPRKVDVLALVRELERKYPDPTPTTPSPYEGLDTTDRRAVSEFIRGRLGARAAVQSSQPARKQAGGKSKRKTG